MRYKFEYLLEYIQAWYQWLYWRTPWGRKKKQRVDLQLKWLRAKWTSENGSMLLTDQPVECPKCGSRTEWMEVDELHQLHTCLNPECGYFFAAEWDPDELDGEGNWVEPKDYDREASYNEPLSWKIGDISTFREAGFGDCGYGCKIYESDILGERVLAHNSAYGCRR